MFAANNQAVPKQSHNATSVLKTQIDSTPVSEIFFSQKNVDALHEAIRYLVYKYSSCQHVIDRQSDTELVLIMRGTYIEYAKNVPFNVLDQVRDLNAMVLDFCVPRILREINMYIKYKRELLKNPVPSARPEFVSTAGTKSLQQPKSLI